MAKEQKSQRLEGVLEVEKILNAAARTLGPQHGFYRSIRLKQGLGRGIQVSETCVAVDPEVATSGNPLNLLTEIFKASQQFDEYRAQCANNYTQELKDTILRCAKRLAKRVPSEEYRKFFEDLLGIGE